MFAQKIITELERIASTDAEETEKREQKKVEEKTVYKQGKSRTKLKTQNWFVKQSKTSIPDEVLPQRSLNYMIDKICMT